MITIFNLIPKQNVKYLTLYLTSSVKSVSIVSTCNNLINSIIYIIDTFHFNNNAVYSATEEVNISL